MIQILRLILASAALAAGPIRQHLVARGDTLWGLSRAYYADAWKWPRIARANPGIGDPNVIYPGQVLVIPDLHPLPEPAARPAPKAVVPQPPVPPAGPAASGEKRPSERLSEDLPRFGDAETERLDDNFPEGLTGYGGSEKIFVPKRWKGGGEVVAAGEGGLGEVGDSVRLRSDRAYAPGSRLAVFRKGSRGPATAPDSVSLERIGLLRILKKEGRRLYSAEVLEALDAVAVGDYVGSGAP